MLLNPNSQTLAVVRASLQAFDFGFTLAPVVASAVEGARAAGGTEFTHLFLVDNASQELVVFVMDDGRGRRVPMQRCVPGLAAQTCTVSVSLREQHEAAACSRLSRGATRELQ